MNDAAVDDLVVVTGPPGSGKTTTLDHLAARGWRVVPESARTVLRLQKVVDGRGVPWKDPVLFSELMIMMDMSRREAALEAGGRHFFDRSLIDAIASLRICGVRVPDHLDLAARRLRYRRRVFITPAWAEIFRQDAERTQTWEDAVDIAGINARTYRDYGYDLVELPKAGVAQRAAFCLAHLDGPGDGSAPREAR